MDFFMNEFFRKFERKKKKERIAAWTNVKQLSSVICFRQLQQDMSKNVKSRDVTLSM
jgi:hypothetical protein